MKLQILFHLKMGKENSKAYIPELDRRMPKGTWSSGV